MYDLYKYVIVKFGEEGGEVGNYREIGCDTYACLYFLFFPVDISKNVNKPWV